MINCQMIIRVGKTFKYLFLQALFSFSFSKLISSFFSFTNIHTRNPDKKNFCKDILHSKARVGEHKDVQQWVQSLLFPLTRVRFPPFCTAIWIPYEGHSFSLNSQLMALCVATLMLFRWFSLNAQKAKCSHLNRFLLFDKNAFPQIGSSTNDATIVSRTAVINCAVNLGNTTYTDMCKKKGRF